MIRSTELTLSPFESALLETTYPPLNHSLVGKSIVVLTILLFSLFYSPAISAKDKSLTPDSLLAVLNADRVRVGLSALTGSAQLDLAARTKALDILQRGYFSHASPDGIQPWDFIREAGFSYSFAGENLAIGYTSPFELHQDFLNSPSHRENLLSPVFSEIGIAVVEGVFHDKPAVVTVQMFASE